MNNTKDNKTQVPSENVVNYIKNSDLKELNLLQLIISEQIKSLEQDNLISTIKHKINSNGYAISVKKIFLPNINIMMLKYYVCLRAYDLNYQSDSKITDTHHNQDPWVDLLKFEYEAGQSDNYEGIVGEWDYCDYLYSGKGYISVYLYYNPSEIPTSNFKVLDENGQVLDCRNKDDQIEVINSGKVIDNVFIIPERCYTTVSYKFLNFSSHEK
jgi:hypothetical protein